MAAPAFRLRPATSADRDFLYRLHAAAMRELVEQVWGWDEAWQRARFDEHFDPVRSRVVVVGNEDVGVLAVERRPNELFLANVEVLPEWQGRGLGTALVRAVLAEGAAAGLPVALQVLHANRAGQLYKRLGFREVGRTATHRLMRAEPATSRVEGEGPMPR